MTPAPERPDPRICGDCGHGWERHLRYPGACADCPCQAFLHNLAAAPVTDAGLDVERLAQAYALTMQHPRVFGGDELVANRIAAEYAALSRQAKETA